MKAEHPVDRLFTRTAAFSALGSALLLTVGAAVAGVDLQAQTFAQLLTAIATIAIALATLRAAQAAAESTRHAAAAAEAARRESQVVVEERQETKRRQQVELNQCIALMRKAVSNLYKMPPTSVLARLQSNGDSVYFALLLKNLPFYVNQNAKAIAECVEGPALKATPFLQDIERQALQILIAQGPHPSPLLGPDDTAPVQPDHKP